ncbi:hypothetical protein C8Q75DRAFT_174060 [Abortiporus biennis]|nr:hypothetical protein C8Q75DRAFT_174060 [Abortiporus biennis]
MSTDTVIASRTKKKSTTDTVKRSPEDDHRRKRRNRMTQSCLNCHTSKRMCDRKRPCGRCTQLGLTGLCVYEVDDPNQRNDVSDEQLRLQKRIAELESVIRELKNKPHPRWVQPDGSRGDGNGQDPQLSQPGHDKAGATANALGASSSSTPALTPSSSTSSPSPSNSASPLHTPPSPLCLTPIDTFSSNYHIPSSLLSPPYLPDSGNLGNIFDSLLGPDGTSLVDPYVMHSHHHAVPGHCGCLQESVNYNVVLELSLRLRRAAEILRQSPKHNPIADCSLHQCISLLDRLTSEALGNINTSYSTSTSAAMCQPSYRTTPAATISPQSLHGVRPWDFKTSAYPSPPSDDSFMSWEPTPHRLSEHWPQPGRR